MRGGGKGEGPLLLRAIGATIQLIGQLPKLNRGHTPGTVVGRVQDINRGGSLTCSEGGGPNISKIVIIE